MAQFRLLRPKIPDICGARGNFDRNPLHNPEAIPFNPDDLPWIVGNQLDLV
jgi:hypothetical protein